MNALYLVMPGCAALLLLTWIATRKERRPIPPGTMCVECKKAPATMRVGKECMCATCEFMWRQPG